MARRFNRDAKEKILQLITSSESAVERARTETLRLPTTEVQRALNLSDMPHARFLSKECWLGGGRILRWLCGEANHLQKTRGDFDFFFPSLEALRHTTENMLAAGYDFHRSLAQPLTLWDLMSGKRGEREAKETVFGKNGDEFLLASRKLSRNMEQVGIELTSPEGDVIQLVMQINESSQEAPTTDNLIVNMDFSICQFMMDDKFLYAGSHAWHDLLSNRFRHVHIVDPLYSHWRFHKYVRRGFWPYAKTSIQVYQAYFRQWAFLLRKGIAGKKNDRRSGSRAGRQP